MGIMKQSHPKKPLTAKIVMILILVQTWRLEGIVFIQGTYQKWLPLVFGLVAGWGGILVAVTAPIIAYWLTRGTLLAWVYAIVWNTLGIADLVVAVSVGVLSKASAMRVFPLVLIPIIGVPSLIVLHALSLFLLARKKTRELYLGSVSRF